MILFSLVSLILFILLIGLFFAVGGLILKLLYTFCVGLPIAICLGVMGMVFCITIIGIPVGLLLFRIAGFVIAPFH